MSDMTSDRRDRRAEDLLIWERLVRFHRQTVRAMDANLQSTFGHTLDDYDVLHQVIANEGPIRMGDLAGRLLLANSSCNRIVGRLVTAGLLSRSRGDVDRREVVIDTTPAGRRLYRRMAAMHTRDIERRFGDLLSTSGRAGLILGLDELHSGMGHAAVPF